MATLAELQTLFNDPTLAAKVQAAAVKTAVSVAFEDTGTTNHAARLVWAKGTLADPISAGTKALKYVLAANASLTLAELNALADATIQSHVDASLAIFAAG